MKKAYREAEATYDVRAENGRVSLFFGGREAIIHMSPAGAQQMACRLLDAAGDTKAPES